MIVDYTTSTLRDLSQLVTHRRIKAVQSARRISIIELYTLDELEAMHGARE